MLGAASGAQDDNSNATIDLGELFRRAQNDRIINKNTSKQLLQLAANMTGSKHPTQLKLPRQESSREKEKVDGLVSEEISGEHNFFMKFYNHLTILNILYFGGTLLVMGAYTLFMTLAYEKCNYVGLSGIMLIQVVVFGMGGVVMWHHYTELQFVGGL